MSWLLDVLVEWVRNRVRCLRCLLLLLLLNRLPLALLLLSATVVLVLRIMHAQSLLVQLLRLKAQFLEQRKFINDTRNKYLRSVTIQCNACGQLCRVCVNERVDWGAQLLFSPGITFLSILLLVKLVDKILMHDRNSALFPRTAISIWIQWNLDRFKGIQEHLLLCRGF